MDTLMWGIVRKWLGRNTFFEYNPEEDPTFGGQSGPAPDPDTSTPDQSVPVSNDPTSAFGPEVGAVPGKAPVKIPTNFLDWIRGASQSSGVPVNVLAGVLYSHMGGWNNRLTPDTVAAVAFHLARTYYDIAQGNMPGSERDDPFNTFSTVSRNIRSGDTLSGWAGAATLYLRGSLWTGDANTWMQSFMTYVQRPYEDSGTEKMGPTSQFRSIMFPGIASEVVNRGPGRAGPRPMDITDAYAIFQQYLGREPKNDAEAQQYVGMSLDAAIARISATGEAQTWREFGGRVKTMRSWVNQLYGQYLGREATNEEIISAIKSGLTDFDKMNSYLRAQPYGQSTLGANADARAIAASAAKKYLGREPTDQEINYLLTTFKDKATPENIDAFYQQLKERMDSGDPAFQWVSDPKTWLDTQGMVQQIWQQLGLSGMPKVGDSDMAHIVNMVLNNKWTAADVKNYFSALPAPGFTGATVGDVNRVRGIAQSWQDHYLPGTQVENNVIAHLLAMTPEEIQGYYRSLPLSMHVDALKKAQTAKAATPAAAGATGGTTGKTAAPAGSAGGTNKTWTPPSTQAPADNEIVPGTGGGGVVKGTPGMDVPGHGWMPIAP